MPERAYTDADLDAAIAAIADPSGCARPRTWSTRAAPSLQRVLDEALAEGGWFDAAHEQAVREATGAEDPDERLRAVRTLVAEETRLGMLVGVAVGFELARELGNDPTPKPNRRTDRRWRSAFSATPASRCRTATRRC